MTNNFQLGETVIATDSCFKKGFARVVICDVMAGLFGETLYHCRVVSKKKKSDFKMFTDKQLKSIKNDE